MGSGFLDRAQGLLEAGTRAFVVLREMRASTLIFNSVYIALF